MKEMCKRLLAFLMVVAVCILFPFGASAKSLQELKEEKAALDAKIEQANQKADAYRNDSAKQMELASALRQETDALQEQIDNLNLQIEELQAQISVLQIQIEENQVRFSHRYAAYCQRLRALYISGSTSTLEVLLTSGGLSDLLTRAELISAISKQDQDTLNELMSTMDAIQTDQDNLNQNKALLDASASELQNQKADKESKIGELQELINELEQKAYEATESVASEEEDSKALEDEINRLTKAMVGGVVGTGQMTMPCPGYSYVSAGYPYYSNGSYHGGVDFAAPYGTSILAADSGTVIAVNYLTTSYGYHVIISHGNGLTTLYGHTSQILVRVGQNVEKGQLIARVGSTGNSTGPHLHFEVRQDGVRRNPWSYL